MTGRAARAVPPDPARPFGLYVHFPFCASRCHYCAFYFVVGRRDARAAYVDALVAEIGQAPADARFAGRGVHSIYFGGGTPSLMAGGDVARVLTAVRAAFDVAEDAEISLESNPDGLSAGALGGLRELGVNRLTLGWQSLRPEGLRILTRTHSVDDNVAALGAAREAGFENVGVDLIFGWPGQTVAGWREELGEAGSLGIEHLSAYELTLEEGTRLLARAEAGRFRLAAEDERAEMFEATDERLAPCGIRRYEISNFAKPGFECRHNLAGWRSGDLLGVGVSSASHVTNQRWTNAKDLDGYVATTLEGGSAAGEAETLNDAIWAAEDLYLGLRTAEGVDAAARLASVPQPVRSDLGGRLEAAGRAGLLDPGPPARLTRRGRLFADTVFDSLLRAPSPASPRGPGARGRGGSARPGARSTRLPHPPGGRSGPASRGATLRPPPRRRPRSRARP